MQRMNRDAHRLRGRWLQVAGRKNMRAARPHTPRQERITCTLANKFAVFFLISWCRCLASAAVQPRRLVVHSTKSPAGAVQSAQWRELDSSSSRAPAEFPAVSEVPVGSRNFVPRPLAVEPPTGRKNMRAARPHTPRQVRVTCTPANKFAVFIKTVWCRLYRILSGRFRKKSPALLQLCISTVYYIGLEQMQSRLFFRTFLQNGIFLGSDTGFLLWNVPWNILSAISPLNAVLSKILCSHTGLTFPISLHT